MYSNSLNQEPISRGLFYISNILCILETVNERPILNVYVWFKGADDKNGANSVAHLLVITSYQRFHRTSTTRINEKTHQCWRQRCIRLHQNWYEWIFPEKEFYEKKVSTKNQKTIRPNRDWARNLFFFAFIRKVTTRAKCFLSMLSLTLDLAPHS